MADSKALKSAIDQVGGPPVAAALCGLTPRGIYKWLARGSLPRTEYTGETNYAELLAAASNDAFSAEWLRENARPKAISSPEAA